MIILLSVITIYGVFMLGSCFLYAIAGPQLGSREFNDYWPWYIIFWPYVGINCTKGF